MTGLSIFFAFPHTTLRISKGVLDALGNPTHLSFHVNADAVSLMIKAADETVLDSLPLPPHYFNHPHKGMKVGRKHFLEAIRLRLGWDKEGRYKVYGTLNSEKDAVFFYVAEAERIS